MWDKMTVYNSISNSCPKAAKCKIRSANYFFWSPFPLSLPISGLSSLSLSAFMFTGVDGFSIDITTTVDIRDQTNKELAMRLVTDIQSGDVFYTDLNGFQVSPHADK